jgi:hypothetical protein
MPPTHLDVDILERFAASDLDPERMIEAGRHLSACAPCRSRLRGEVAGGKAGPKKHPPTTRESSNAFKLKPWRESRL